MFVCDCPTCGRRELRGPRSLNAPTSPEATTWTARCRGCGATVGIVDQRRGTPAAADTPAPVAA